MTPTAVQSSHPESRIPHPESVHIAFLGIRGVPSGYSGYETFTQQVGPRLVERGHRVTVYCRRSLFQERPPEYKGMELIYLPSIQTKSLSTFSHTALAALHVAFRRADVAMFVNVANSPFCAITKFSGIRTVLNVDGMEWLRPKWGPTGKKYFHTAAKLCRWTTDQVVTDAARMQEIYREEFHVDSEDIAYGADPNPALGSDRIRALGLDPEGYLLTACRLVPDNNVDVLLEGFRQTTTSKKYVIVGSTPYASAYVDELHAKADERVQFLGHIDDQDLMDELYAHAYAYLHAHEFGGINPTLLRAMAGRNCVIALDTPFNHEALGPNGLFFTKGDSSLAEAIRTLSSDEPHRSELAGGALEKVRTHYTWDRITDQYEALFLSMVGKTRYIHVDE